MRWGSALIHPPPSLLDWFISFGDCLFLLFFVGMVSQCVLLLCKRSWIYRSEDRILVWFVCAVCDRGNQCSTVDVLELMMFKFNVASKQGCVVTKLWCLTHSILLHSFNYKTKTWHLFGEGLGNPHQKRDLLSFWKKRERGGDRKLRFGTDDEIRTQQQHTWLQTKQIQNDKDLNKINTNVYTCTACTQNRNHFNLQK